MFRQTRPGQQDQTILGLLGQDASNITFVINQQELCDNIIGPNIFEDLELKNGASAKGSSDAKSAQKSESHQLITDFTLMDFRYLLVLVNKRNVVVFDCQQLLTGDAR